jgi:hypothetical protein
MVVASRLGKQYVMPPPPRSLQLLVTTTPFDFCDVNFCRRHV